MGRRRLAVCIHIPFCNVVRARTVVFNESTFSVALYKLRMAVADQWSAHWFRFAMLCLHRVF
jgi:hypothetical protein